MTNATDLTTFCGLDCPVPALDDAEQQACIILTKNVRDALDLDLSDYLEETMKKKDIASLLPVGSDSGLEAETVPVIWEADFYGTIFESKAPAAHPFRKWLTASVLPIFKTDGSFSFGKNGEQSKANYDGGDELDLKRLEISRFRFYLFNRVLPALRITGACGAGLTRDGDTAKYPQST